MKGDKFVDHLSDRPPRWVYIVYTAFWVLLLAGFVEYYVSYERINPLGVLLLFSMAVGSMLGPRWLKQPFFTTKGIKERLIFMAFLGGTVVGFIFAILVVMRIFPP